MGLLILGIGYCGARLATKLVNEGWDVYATSRENKCDVKGVKLVHCDANGVVDADELATVLLKVTHIVATAPVDKKSEQDPFITKHNELFKKAAVYGNIQWMGYLSTTSVYGNHDGRWIDETTPNNPDLKRGQLRVNAETGWYATGLPVHIFRLPGIYGPYRGSLAKARSGRANCIVKENQVFSRIHVDDIVNALVKSMEKPNPGRIYNVVDDEPAPNHIVVKYCCELLNLPPPTETKYEDADLSPILRSFYEDNKRVRNNRIKEELGVKLLYPTYREGVLAQLKEEKQLSAKANGETDERPRIESATQESLSIPCLPTITEHVNYLISVAPHYTQSVWKGWVSYFSGETEYKNVLCILVDNGSLRPDPTLKLRTLALQLTDRLRKKKLNVSVLPVSARHSNKVSPEKLGGVRAEVLEGFAAANENVHQTKIVCLPLFLGPSTTIVDYVPKTLEKVCSRGNKLVIAKSLVDNCQPFNAKDVSIASMLFEQISEIQRQQELKEPLKVILVDHGTPNVKVNHTRRSLASQLRLLINDPLSQVLDCSMERRAGKEYDFNNPLLEDAFKLGGWSSGNVIVAFAFLSPGRHAGPDGDLDEILATIQQSNPGLNIFKTGLLADDKNVNNLLSVLEQRYIDACKA